MGEVLLAQRTDDQFHKRVAIKLIRKGIDDGTDGREVLKRFELERQVLAALNHPNIARLIDAGQMPGPDGRPYFVMEYVEGEPIDEFCDRMQLNTEQRLALFAKVCAAVHHAHQNLVVHRDIKPSNIMVDSTGEPKLMDFGIAKLLNPAMSGVTFATQFDRGPMTPEYASPEQVSGKPLTTVSDVYALGVLLYELLTGRRPYQLKSRAMDAMVSAILNDEPERPSTAVMHALEEPTEEAGRTRTVDAASLAKPREGEITRLKRKLAGDIDNIVLMAMRKSPQRRYASAQAFAEDIERHLGGQPVKAHPESVTYVLVKFIRRNRVGVGAAGIALAAIVGAAVVSTVAWQRTSVTLKRESEALQKETEARAKAESAEKATLSLAGEFVRGISRLASAQEGAAPSMLAIADATRNAIESNEASFGTSAQARSLLASAYELQAKVYAGVRGNSAGSPAKGLEIIDKAVNIRAALAKEVPGQGATLGHAVALIYKRDILRILGKTPEANAVTDQAFAMLQALGSAVTDDPTAVRLYTSLLLSKADEREHAARGELIKQALQLREQAAAKYSETIYERDLTVALNRSGRWLAASGQPDEGLAQLQRALVMRARIMDQDPTARSQRDWCIAVNALLDETLQQQRTVSDELRLAVARAEKRADVLAQDEPTTSRSFADATRAIADSGRVEFASGEYAKAIEKLRVAADRSALSGTDRSDRSYDRAAILHQLAMAQSRAGLQGDAAATCRNALSVLRLDVLANVESARDLEQQVQDLLDSFRK